MHATSGRWGDADDAALKALEQKLTSEADTRKAQQDAALKASVDATKGEIDALGQKLAAQKTQEAIASRAQGSRLDDMQQQCAAKGDLVSLLTKRLADLEGLLEGLKNPGVVLNLTANDEAYITFTEGVYKALTAFTTQAEPLLNSLLASADHECDAKLAFFLCGAVKDIQAVYEGTMSSGMADALTTALMGFEKDPSLVNWPKPDNKILKDQSAQAFNMWDRIWERWRDGGTFKSALQSKAFQTNPEADTPSRQYVDQMIALQKKTPEFADLRKCLAAKNGGASSHGTGTPGAANDGRLDAMQQKCDAKDARLDAMQEKCDAKDALIAALTKRVDGVEKRLLVNGKRVNALEGQLTTR